MRENNERGATSEDWSGWLVIVKDEWLNHGERKQPMVVLEDRGDRILIQQLPQYKPECRTFLHTESVLKIWVDVVDTEIINCQKAEPDCMNCKEESRPECYNMLK